MFRSVKNLALFGTGTAFGFILTVVLAFRFIFTNKYTAPAATELVSDVSSTVFQRILFDEVTPRRRGYKSYTDYHRYGPTPVREATATIEETP